MFGLFGKKKAVTALDAMIHATYGNPPPRKTARVDDAVRLANEDLLLDLVPRAEVQAHAARLNEGKIPYSTHDLAISVALYFFRQPAYLPVLQEAQLAARLQLVDWIMQGKVNPILAKTFEDNLYRLYKPAA